MKDKKTFKARWLIILTILGLIVGGLFMYGFMYHYKTDLKICNSDLTSTQNSLNACNSDLTTCKASIVTCDTQKDVCKTIQNDCQYKDRPAQPNLIVAEKVYQNTQSNCAKAHDRSLC